ncbi:MAG: hypothetical protein ACKPCP_09320 [Sphaerospermopsis kisseleviana]
MTVFVALIQLPYEGESFVGVYSTYAKAEKALLEEWEKLKREADLVIAETQIDTQIGSRKENVVSWKVKPPQRQWKEW